MTTLRPVPQTEALAVVGESIHTALRRAGCSEEAHKAWLAIWDMDVTEWGEIVMWFLNNLATAGYQLGAEEYTTSGGIKLTDERIEQLAAEAEGGYDISKLRPRTERPSR